MKKIILVLTVLLFIVTVSFATTQAVKIQDNIRFGNKSFIIPPPKGFFEITKLNSEWQKNANYFVGEGTKNFGFFVSKEALEKLRNSKYFEIIGDYYFLNIDTQFENKRISTKEFNELKDLVKKDNATDQNVKEINEYLKQNEDSIGKIFNNNRKLQVGDMLLLGVFNENERSISTAFIVRRIAKIDGKIITDYKIGFLSYAYVNGAVLIATGYSLQEISKAETFFLDWINNILKNNTVN